MTERTTRKPRGMGDFAVYASPGEVDFANDAPPSDGSLWDQAAGAPAADTSLPSRRSLRENERARKAPVSRLADESATDLLAGQEIYQDPDKVNPVKGHRFPADTSLTVGHRIAYKVNARGAVIFTPGWTPARVMRAHLRAAAVWALLIAMSLAGTWYLCSNHIGSDRAYNEMVSRGQSIQVAVASNQVDTKEASNGYTTVRNVTETATAPFTTESGKKGTVKVVTAREMRLDGEYQPVHPEGSTIHIAFDPQNPSKYVVVDPDAPGQMNWVSASPLVMGFFAGVGMLARLYAAARMSRLGRALKKAN